MNDSSLLGMAVAALIIALASLMAWKLGRNVTNESV